MKEKHFISISYGTNKNLFLRVISIRGVLVSSLNLKIGHENKKNKNRSQKDSPTFVPLSKIGRANIRYQVNIFWFTRGFVNLAKPTMCSLGNFYVLSLIWSQGSKQIQ